MYYEEDDDEPVFEGGDQDYFSAAGWDPLQEERERHNAIKRQIAEENAIPAVLVPQTMERWMHRTRCVPESSDRFFGPLWHDRELTFMFASAGLGKSIFAAQMAEYLARGVRMSPFDAAIRPEPLRVLYCDFELSREQVRLRYSVAAKNGALLRDHYSFSPLVIRTEMHWNGIVPARFENFSDMLFDELHALVSYEKFDVLIIDNITFLDRRSTSNVNTALSLMLRLNELKKACGIGILVLAHTPKRRAPHLPLTEADLQGSVNLANLADSVFAMGRSFHEPSVRYFKQLKSRSAAVKYDEMKVPVFRLEKFDLAASIGLAANGDREPLKNFLGLDFVEYAPEHDLLADHPTARRRMVRLGTQRSAAEVKRLQKEGLSLGQIGEKLGMPKTTVHRYASRTH